MAEKRMTKKDWYNIIESIVADSDSADKNEILDFIHHEIALLERKNNSKRSSQTPRQRENLRIMEDIIATLSGANDPLSITELQEINSDLKIFSCQKLSALLHQLIEKGEVIRIMDKRKAYYTIAS